MWSTILGILIGILVFMFLVIAHEFGHFMAARKCGMKVPEFGIGLPPKICNLWKDKQGTQYTLNWIPLGGFCQIEGDDPTDKKSFDNPNTLFTAPLWKRLIVIFAGVAMNFLIAIIVLIGIFWYGTQPLSVSQVAEDKGSTSYLMASSTFLREQGFLTGEVEAGILVHQVNEGGLGAQIDLRPDDVLLQFDGIDLEYSTFLALMTSGADSSHIFTIQRGEIQLDTEEFKCEGTCMFGITISENGDIQLNDIKFGFLGAVKAAFHEIGAEWKLTMSLLGDFGKSIATFKKKEMKTAINTLSGPVGIMWLFVEIFKIGDFKDCISLCTLLMVVISIGLGIFNVLPIPALDGGRAVGMILQAIFRIKPEKYFKYEGYVNTFFFYLILLLGVIIIIKDLIVFRGVNIPFIS